MHITLIPVFKMAKSTGLYDSIWALIGPYIAFAVPISVFILTSFMKEIPREIEESAEIDGCGKIQMFFSMILPLAKPAVSAPIFFSRKPIIKRAIKSFIPQGRRAIMIITQRPWTEPWKAALTM